MQTHYLRVISEQYTAVNNNMKSILRMAPDCDFLDNAPDSTLVHECLHVRVQ